MQQAVSLLLRRMRWPLLTLIVVYAVSILGLVLIPGQDDQGNPWRMDFFHAFYFVSFMGTTIGFGEIPYPFTDAQRMWTTGSIYATVVAWLYAIGTLLSVIQDRAFRRVLEYSGFTRSVRRLTDPFYILCGYGDTGRLLVRELAERGIPTTVIDPDEARIQDLAVEPLPLYVPGLCADGSDSDSLLAAGLRHPRCKGVLAVSARDAVNLKVAITTRLLTPWLQVICRAETHDAAANMASFGTDHIVNAFDTFGERLAMMFRSPSMYLVFEWITAVYGAPLEEFRVPPRGKWVLCGYGRFGKAVHEHLSREGIALTVIEADPARTAPPDGFVHGRGTEAITLEEAGIRDAVGVIAGTDDDANNLSILITARDLKPDLFTIGRQNQYSNDAIFQAADIDLIVQPGTLIARAMLDVITTPLLPDFLALARRQDDEWANVLVSRVSGVVTNKSPITWSVSIDENEAPAVTAMLRDGVRVSIAHLSTSPYDWTARLACLPLLLVRNRDMHLLPDDEVVLAAGDELLFCGTAEARRGMRATASNYNVLDYVITGTTHPAGTVWRWLDRRRTPQRQAST